ncbi:hypothetical protein E3N88_33114 [Mikania micrantha]|uniref:RRM domain-containing protein n=1 Tax=Mikania micrantha TaxID=192012 RepID=A0A5N6MAG4_9ASTR|nr:hypothetical protein E3N88_33114 [Mikania micrantha]
MEKERNEGNEDGIWEKVSHRRRAKHERQAPLAGAEEKNVTTIFITNLPDEFNGGMLWKMCMSMGNLADAFIAKKKDKGGNTFGFVRFRNVKNTAGIVEEINRVKLGGVKIFANVAKYGRNKKPVVPPVFKRRIESNPGKPFISEYPSFYGGGRSFKDVVAGHQTSGLENKPIIHIKIDKLWESNSWRNRSLIGESLDLNTLNNAKSILVDSGIPNSELKYIGGLRLMIVFNSSKECKDYWKLKDKEWKKVFKNLELWKGESPSFDRIAWVKVMGVPLHLWDYKIFDQIAKNYGQIIAPAFNFESKSDVSEGWFCVLTKSRRRIEESRWISFQNQKFEIGLQEESRSWIPDEINNNLPMEAPSDQVAPEKKANGEDTEQSNQDVEKTDEDADSGKYNQNDNNTPTNTPGNLEKMHIGNKNYVENSDMGGDINFSPSIRVMDSEAHQHSGPEDRINFVMGPNEETNSESLNYYGPNEKSPTEENSDEINISIDLNKSIHDNDESVSYSNRRRMAKPTRFGRQITNDRCWVSMHNRRTDKYWEARRISSQSSMVDSSQSIVEESVEVLNEVNQETNHLEHANADTDEAAINAEVSHTLEIGTLVGFELHGKEDLIKEALLADGVNNSKTRLVRLESMV